MRAREHRGSTALQWLALVPFGIVLLAESVGWCVAGLRNPVSPVDPLPAVVYRGGQVLAVLAPVLWAAVVVWLLRVLSRRVIWLAVGAVVLLPWPLAFGAS